MSQQSDMADAIHQRLQAAPVPAAHLVRELRTRWGPDHNVSEVHLFVDEVATGLLHHPDVEIGDVTPEGFLPWSLEPWDADEKLSTELMTLDTFLDDETRYVFRKAHAV